MCTFGVLGLLCEAPVAPEEKWENLPIRKDASHVRGSPERKVGPREKGEKEQHFGRSWGRAVLGVSWVGVSGGLNPA